VFDQEAYLLMNFHTLPFYVCVRNKCDAVKPPNHQFSFACDCIRNKGISLAKKGIHDRIVATCDRKASTGQIPKHRIILFNHNAISSFCHSLPTLNNKDEFEEGLENNQSEYYWHWRIERQVVYSS